MNRLATVAIAALLLGSSAVLAAPSSPGGDGGGAPVTGPMSRPAASPNAFDLNLLRNSVDAHGRLWAQAQACQKADQPCDDQNKCCRGLVCVSVLSSRTKICDVRP